MVMKKQNQKVQREAWLREEVSIQMLQKSTQHSFAVRLQPTLLLLLLLISQFLLASVPLHCWTLQSCFQILRFGYIYICMRFFIGTFGVVFQSKFQFLPQWSTKYEFALKIIDFVWVTFQSWLENGLLHLGLLLCDHPFPLFWNFPWRFDFLFFVFFFCFLIGVVGNAIITHHGEFLRDANSSSLFCSSESGIVNYFLWLLTNPKCNWGCVVLSVSEACKQFIKWLMPVSVTGMTMNFIKLSMLAVADALLLQSIPPFFCMIWILKTIQFSWMCLMQRMGSKSLCQLSTVTHSKLETCFDNVWILLNKYQWSRVFCVVFVDRSREL